MSHKALLFIHALTSLHPGSGTALGVVDLPIQRERHTGWPIIPGSSLKGVLRDECRRAVSRKRNISLDAANEDEDVTVVFGPARVEESETAHAGAITVTDAHVIAFPVRSMQGVFAWVTCPAVLERLARDLAYLGSGEHDSALPATWPASIPRPDRNEAVVPAETELVVRSGGKESLILEEFEFKKSSGSTSDLADWFAQYAVHEAMAERMRASLVVLHDDDYTYFVRNATEIVARVALDYARKTVKRGAFFYEEFLPPETLLVSLLTFEDARRVSSDRRGAMEVFAALKEHIPAYVQIGADETIGKGLCAIRLVNQGGL